MVVSLPYSNQHSKNYLCLKLQQYGFLLLPTEQACLPTLYFTTPSLAFSELMTFLLLSQHTLHPLHQLTFSMRSIHFSNANKDAVNCSSTAFVQLYITSF